MKNFKNIIFDLGGVVLDIDYNKTIEAFRNLGITDASILYSKSSQIKLFDELEKGNLAENDFYSGIRKLSKSQVSDVEIANAWNAILTGLQDKNVKFLTELKKDHRLFLLSNTNCFHERAYRKMITEQYGRFIFDDLFEKMYLSHHLHMRKPDAEIFRYVFDDSKLRIEETCFIDDSIQHVEGARKLKITSFLFNDQNLELFFQRNSLVEH